MLGIKRLLLFMMIPLLCAIPASPQDVKTPTRKDNLYSIALFASLAEMDKQWSRFSDFDSEGYARTDYHKMCVKKDPEITDGMPSQEGDFHVEYLDSQNLIKRYKNLRKKFAVVEIHPMYSDGSKLKIEIGVSYVEFKKRKLMLLVSDWSDVEFRFDSETQKYVISSIKLGGI